MIDVRPLAAEELDSIAAGIPSRPIATHRRRLERQARGGFSYLVAWVDGTAGGSVGVGFPDGPLVDELCELRGYPFVLDLHVEEPFRGRGVGRALMRAVESSVRSIGERGIMLSTGTGGDFDAARGLYRSLGYRDLGGVYLAGWSDRERPTVHPVDRLTQWVKFL